MTTHTEQFYANQTMVATFKSSLTDDEKKTYGRNCRCDACTSVFSCFTDASVLGCLKCDLWDYYVVADTRKFMKLPPLSVTVLFFTLKIRRTRCAPSGLHWRRRLLANTFVCAECLNIPSIQLYNPNLPDADQVVTPKSTDCLNFLFEHQLNYLVKSGINCFTWNTQMAVDLVGDLVWKVVSGFHQG